MSDARNLVVVGEAPLATLAAAIGIIVRGPARVRVVELSPDQIGDNDLAFLSGFESGATDVFAAIGPSALNYARFDLWAKLKLKGCRFATLVHPRAIVDAGARLAENVLIGANASIEPGVRVGRGTIVGAAATIEAESTIDDWTWVASGVVIGSRASIGAHVVLGSGVHVANGTDFPGPGELDMPGTYRGKIAAGTFVSPEFAGEGVRLIQAG